MRVRMVGAVVVVALAATMATGCAVHAREAAAEPEDTAARSPFLVTVDHFLATSTEARSIYLVFRDTFGLPVVWPFQSYGDFASGGLSLGNTVVEFAVWETPKGEPLKTEWKELAFEPAGDSAAAAAEFTRRGVAHSEPEVSRYRDAEGVEHVAWTNTELGGAGLSGIAFVCDYAAREKVAAKHRVGAEELARAGGGPLGITRVRAIQVGVTDLRAARAEWRKLVALSGGDEEDLFRFGFGPEVQLVNAAAPGIRGIVLEVASLEKARAFLASRHMLARVDGDGLAIAPEAIGGLAVTLVGG